jgi:regulator of protease activity HflC (stomatin/prohibitin superfamily)
MLTGDLNTASVEWTVQWKVTEPSQYLFRFLVHSTSACSNLITFVAAPVMNRLEALLFDRTVKRRHRQRGPHRHQRILKPCNADYQRLANAA